MWTWRICAQNILAKKKKKKRPMTQCRLARFCYYHNEKAGSHDSSFPVGAYANPVVPRGAEPVDGMGSMQSASDWRATIMFHECRHSPCSSQAKQRGVTLNRDLLIKIAGSSTVTLYICQFTLLQRTTTPVAFFGSWKLIVQAAQRFCCDGCVSRQARLCVSVMWCFGCGGHAASASLLT